MSSPDRPESDPDRDGDRSRRRTARSDGVVGWFAESTVRVALAVLGVLLLLFAVGQMVGLDILGSIADALETEFGRWLLIAIFALLLIIIALRGFYSYPD